MAWQYPGEGEDVLVVHTLCVPPRFAGHRYGSRMVQYAKEYAAGHGCAVVRLDTYAHNGETPVPTVRIPHRRVGAALLQGLMEEEQVYLEYGLQ